MRLQTVRTPLMAVAAGVLAQALVASPSLAQATKPEGAVVAPVKAVVLTPEEVAEREMRKACKVQICAAFRNRKADGGDVSCSVLKSWRKEQLSKMLERAKVSWPWGPVKCSADIKLKRDMLIKSMSEAKYEAKLDTHQVVCEVEREAAAKAEIKFAFTPKVTFENGKATKAVLGWGKIEAPTLVKGAMWTATATDNTFNVLQSTIVEDINNFIGPNCDEVKAEWSGK